MCLTSRDPPSDELWQMLCAHVGPTPNVVFVLNSVAVSKHCGCSNLFFGVAGGGACTCNPAAHSYWLVHEGIGDMCVVGRVC